MPNNPTYNAMRRGTRNEYYRNRRLALYATPIGRADNLVRRYNNEDKKRGFDISNNVTKEWVVDNIFSGSCFYCGDSNWEHLGCDRIDNSLPHTEDNVLCSCGICNTERACKNMSVSEFKNYRNNQPRLIDLIERKRKGFKGG